MDWYWHVAIHAAAVYYTIGYMLAWRWAPNDTGPFERLVGSILMAFFWVFMLEPGDSKYVPNRKTKDTQALRTERVRMNAELAAETAKVELLEASGDHRRAMAELHERRRRAEEI